ncbi:acyltransferase [Halobacillus salinus]|uniref:acyltransferase n=1 Tax=Halobacillus salinus TaxID=192814 RepID=UPI0009A63C6C|nr:acyltransferase [Halobacillus salinus]
MNEQIKKQNFFEEIPFVRAIACMLVVLVHTSARNYDVDHFISDIGMYFNQIARLGTPIFAVISAFLLTSSVIKRGFSLKKFVTSRAVKILSPYIIWSFVYLAYNKIILGAEVFPNWKQTLDYFLLGDARTHLYFIVTVIHFYILFPFLQLIRNRMALIVLFLLSTVLNYFWLKDMYPDLSVIFGEWTYIITNRSFIFNWISFFMFGMVLAYFWKDVLKLIKKYEWIVYGMAFVLFIFVFMEIQPGVVLSSSRVENLFYIPVFVIFLLLVSTYVIKQPMLFKPFKLIGDYSMGIYLVHPLVLIFIEKLLPNLFVRALGISTAFTLAMIISVLIIKGISLLPKSTFIVPIPKVKK